MSRTILLADDHQIVRQGLRAILKAEPGLVVVGEAANGFVKAALGRRGVVGQVLDPGLVRPGDIVQVHLPALIST